MKIGQLTTEPHCPKCKNLLDGFTHAEDRTPAPGDISVCVYCHEILEFTDRMDFKIAPAESIAQCDFLQLQLVNKLVRALADVRRDE